LSLLDILTSFIFHLLAHFSLLVFKLLSQVYSHKAPNLYQY